ncbi:MAG: hypothetical protein ACRD8U_24480 [Pyrinomonadaceae bacterium]
MVETLITCSSASCTVLKLFLLTLLLPVLVAFAFLLVFILKSRLTQLHEPKDDFGSHLQRRH